MVLERQILYDDLAVFVGNNPPGRRKVRGADADMGVGEAFHVGQFAVGRRIVIDRVLGGEILLVLCDGALLDVDREGERVHTGMGHLAVDLCDTVVLDPIEGIGAMDIQFCAERMTVFLHRQRILSV